MDLRRQEEEERGCNPSPSLSPAAPPPPPPPPPIKDSAFSRPLLPLNSSLLQQGLQRGEARNGGSGYTVAPSSFSPLNFTGGGGRLKSPVSLISSSSSNNRSILAAELTWHYRECQKNHAAGMGGHVLDGCCEFMPSDDVALKCAACGCHRSFHRKVSGPNPNGAAANHRMPPVQLLPPPPPPPLPPPSQSSSEELIGGTPCQSKKRFRTRFTPEQKEKMFKFAESLSWRFQKPDDAAIDEFCAEAGLNRQVLKVWMHNNKYTYKKQEQYQPPQLPPQQEMPQEILPHQEPHQIPEQHQQIP